MCVPVCSPIDNCSSDCLSLTNCCHQNSLSNLTTDNFGKATNKITYEISVNNSNKYPRQLSYLHKLKSKSNPYLNLRRNYSNENFICRHQSNINDARYNYLDNNNKYSSNHSNYDIKRNNSNDFSFLRKSNDRDIISSRINGKRNDLLDKIKSMSNRIDKAINKYQDNNIESPIYNECNNDYNFGLFSNGGVESDEKYNTYKSKPKHSGINYNKIDLLKQNYNKKNKFLEKMKKNSEREKKLIDLKINNLSGVINGNNIYNRIGNNLTKLKKEKPDYDSIFNDKNQYLNDNNIINSNANIYKQNIYKDKNNINYKDKTLFNNNYKNKLHNENSNLVNDEENSLFYKYNRNNDDSFNENNQKKDTSIRLHYERNKLKENDGCNNNFENDNNNNYYNGNLKENNYNLDYANNLNNYENNNYNNNKRNIININEYEPNNDDSALNNGRNNNDFQKNYYSNRNVNKNVNNKNNYVEEGNDENCINERKYPNEYIIRNRKYESYNNINDINRKKDYNNDNNIYIKNQYIQKNNRSNKDMNDGNENEEIYNRNDNQNDDMYRKNNNFKRNNYSSVDNIFAYNKKYTDKFNNDYNIECPESNLNNEFDDENNNINKVNNNADYNNDLNFNYDEDINNKRNDDNKNCDYNDFQTNRENKMPQKTYVIDYSQNKNQEQYNDSNENKYIDNNYRQNNDINDLVKYTDKDYNQNNNNDVNINNNDNDNEEYIEEESIDIYNRSFSDYIYKTDKKNRDRYDNNYYEEIIHTKRYKDYMLSSADEDIPKNKSVEIRRRRKYNLHSYKSKIRNNSENHRRVFLNKNNNSNNYRSMIHNYNLNDQLKGYGRNFNYDNICNKRYYNRGFYTYCYNPCCHSFNVYNNYNCQNYLRRCQPRFFSCDENRNYSEENIRNINKKIEKNNNYYDNINLPKNNSINASSNYYTKIKRKLKGNNRLGDIINESNDFPKKINQKRNINIEVENVQRKKSPNNNIKNENNIIPKRNLERNDDVSSNIIKKTNVYEKYTYNNIEENNKIPKLKELEDEITKLKSNYTTLENKYNKLIKENERLTKISTKNVQIESELKEYRTNLNSYKRKNNINEAKIKKLETTNQELLSKLKTNSIRSESKDNSLRNETKNILNENRKLKDQIKRLELENKNMTYVNKENKRSLDELLVRHNELLVKYNNLNLKKNEDKIDRTNPIFSIKKDEKYNNHLILTVKKVYGKLNKDIDELNSDKYSTTMKYKSNNTIIKKYNNKDDDILGNDDYERLEAHYKILKNENQRLKMELNKIDNKNNDQLVIVNKETTLKDSNNNMEINNNFSVKKNLEITDGDLNKYHEIIQDLNNLVLIYENFFFKRDVKPKNNSELQCVLIVEYIKKKIRRINLNTLINLIIYKNSIPKKNDDKNGESNDK